MINTPPPKVSNKRHLNPIEDVEGMMSESDSGAERLQNQRSFERAISHKAFQFGADSGVTAEFIVKQASYQLA